MAQSPVTAPNMIPAQATGTDQAFFSTLANYRLGARERSLEGRQALDFPISLARILESAH
jgi:hypothetical protein